LPEHTFGLVKHKYAIDWNLKNVQLFWVFADPVTIYSGERLISTSNDSICYVTVSKFRA